MATPNQSDAAKSAQEFVKYLLVLGVGALGFALTSLTATQKDMHCIKFMIMIACGLLGISVFFGILAYGSLVSQVFRDAIDMEANPLRWQAIGQWLLFFAGIVVLGAAILLREHPGTTTTHSPHGFL